MKEGWPSYMYSVPSNLHSKNNTVCIGINCYYYYHYHSEGVKKISYTIYIILTPQNKFEIRLIIFREQGGGDIPREKFNQNNCF